MQDCLGVFPAKSYGQLVAAFATFVPSGAATQTLTDAFGIKSIARSVAGRWVVTLAERFPGFSVALTALDNDTTNLHDLRLESVDLTAGTFTFVHRTAAFGSLASLALSDTIDAIHITVLGRMAT